jgi:hypothetical protein
MANNNLETFSGQGAVLNGHVEVAKVSYNLVVKKEIMMTDSITSSVLDRYRFIDGSLKVLEGEMYLLNLERLTLQIENDRKVDFSIKKGEPMTGDYRIQPIGNFY